jgi:hypothetical protein
VDATGHWSAALDLSSLADGDIHFTASVTDAAGNSSLNTSMTSKDASGEEILWGPLATVTATNQASFPVKGSGEVGDTLALSATDGAVTVSGSATVDATGHWSAALDLSSLADGDIHFTASVTDAAGNSSLNTSMTSKDASGEQIVWAALATVTAANQASFPVKGSGEVGDTLALSATDGAVTVSGSAVVDASGHWSTALDLSSLADGDIHFTASVTDAAGNTSLNTSMTTKDASGEQQATPTLTWRNPADIVYGTSLGGTQLNATASVPGTFLYAPAPGTVLNAGSNQTLTVIFTPTDTTSYATVRTSVTINVNPAPLTVTANPQWKIAGEANPTFTVRFDGFVLGQDRSALGGTLTFSTTATINSLPGTYYITPAGLTSGNYTIAFVPGTLTVLSYNQATTSLLTHVDGAGLPQGTQSSLDSKLQSAISSFNGGATRAGVNQLGAFINEVKAQKGKKIDAALADALIAHAERIINAVG